MSISDMLPVDARNRADQTPMVGHCLNYLSGFFVAATGCEALLVGVIDDSTTLALAETMTIGTGAVVVTRAWESVMIEVSGHPSAIEADRRGNLHILAYSAPLLAL